MKRISDIIGYIEYPSLDELTNMPSDMMYNYISSTFCIVCANKLTNKSSYMIARYSVDDNIDYRGSYYLSDDDELLRIYYKNIQFLKTIDEDDWYHTDLGRYCIDDVIICGESSNNYYCFWFDKDVSDCSIIKVSKEHYDCLYNFNMAIIEHFQSLEFKIEKIRKPTGWFKW